MVEYLIGALVWGIITEYIFEITRGEMDFHMRIINLVFFPFILCIFTYNFIVEFKKQS
jgi:hypothetical protein